MVVIPVGPARAGRAPPGDRAEIEFAIEMRKTAHYLREASQRSISPSASAIQPSIQEQSGSGRRSVFFGPSPATLRTLRKVE